MVVNTKLSYEEVRKREIARSDKFETIGVWVAVGILAFAWLVGQVLS